jgi:predicted O-methyltransferase YrrM
MARVLPDSGYLLTMEADPHHADVAGQSIVSAGLNDVVEIRRGPALETFVALSKTSPEPFDLFFIDADKEHNPDYFDWAVRLSHPGSVIVVDNVVRDGGVLDAESADAAIQGTRRLYDVVGAEQRVTATAIQTVGNKGYDGFLIARVN